MSREQGVELHEAVLALVKLIVHEVFGAVRRRDDQQAVIGEDPPELGNRGDIVVEMFDYFEADEQVEGFRPRTAGSWRPTRWNVRP